MPQFPCPKTFSILNHTFKMVFDVLIYALALFGAFSSLALGNKSAADPHTAMDQRRELQSRHVTRAEVVRHATRTKRE